MTDNNPRTQQYLQTIKEDIFRLHVVEGRSINEVHRVLVHHRDPWFTYSSLVHAVNRWKELEPLRWRPLPTIIQPPMPTQQGYLIGNDNAQATGQAAQATGQATLASALAPTLAPAPAARPASNPFPFSQTPTPRSRAAAGFRSNPEALRRSGSLGVGQGTYAHHVDVFPQQFEQGNSAGSDQTLDDTEVCTRCPGWGECEFCGDA